MPLSSILKFILAFKALKILSIHSNLSSVKLFSILDICDLLTQTSSPNYDEFFLQK